MLFAQRFRTGKGNREVAYREGSYDPYTYSYCFIKDLSSARNWGRVRLKMKETGLKKNPLVVAAMRLTAAFNHSSQRIGHIQAMNERALSLSNPRYMSTRCKFYIMD